MTCQRSHSSGLDSGLTGSQAQLTCKFPFVPTTPGLSSDPHLTLFLLLHLSTLAPRQVSLKPPRASRKHPGITTRGKTKVVLRCFLLAGLRMGEGGAYGEVPGEQEKPLNLLGKWGPSRGHGLLEGEGAEPPTVVIW